MLRMFGRHSKSEAILAALAIICLTAACALNTGSSKLSYGGPAAVAGFPSRVGVATLVGNLTARNEATSRLSRGLVDLGFQVDARSWDLDRILRWSADGVYENIPEEIRKNWKSVMDCRAYSLELCPKIRDDSSMRLDFH